MIPIASGSLLTKVDKAFRELGRSGWSSDSPYRVFGAQADGLLAGRDGVPAGLDVVSPVKPDTIAKSLAIGNPADGPYALDVGRRTGGPVEDVSDDEVVEGIRLLARTEGDLRRDRGRRDGGDAAQAAGRAGQLDPDAETVVYNTGDGLKTLDAVADRVGPGDDRADVRRIPATGLTRPSGSTGE